MCLSPPFTSANHYSHQETKKKKKEPLMLPLISLQSTLDGLRKLGAQQVIRDSRWAPTECGQQGDDGRDAGAGFTLGGQAGLGGRAGQRGVVAPIVDLVQATQQLLDQAVPGQRSRVHWASGEAVRQRCEAPQSSVSNLRIKCKQ